MEIDVEASKLLRGAAESDGEGVRPARHWLILFPVAGLLTVPVCCFNILHLAHPAGDGVSCNAVDKEQRG